ncbi:DUF885 domain-containing protein [Galbibacter orientalis]|uniref:DUF885 domain-containing protein n=1 Tax=Galbibacter orientalis DSM 19592 TaxID=926559 RepID=I3C3U6_9FLAO|nr:DUF885 domain-containing protein [Galbibacter orientalis]EIJ38289.1 hypothetical protein JoomaDRAFT_1273 [Galbibacter orientalis DSM 19592]
MSKIISGFFYQLLILSVFLVSCKSEEEDASMQLLNIIQEVDNFKVEGTEKHPLGNYEKELYKKEADFAQQQLQKLESLNPESLTETERISSELLQFKLKDIVDFNKFEMYLNPIQADQGFHLNLNYRVKPILDYEDAKAYLNVLNDIPHFVDQNIALIKEGLEKGVSQPKIIFKGYESSYNKHIVDSYTESYFYSPFEKLPTTFTQHQKDSILQEAQTAITKNVIPSFKKIKTFFEEDYIPNTRDAIGVSETPGGKEFYQNRINFYTTTTGYTADDIHKIGLSEVARIRTEMDKIIAEVGFDGSFPEFLNFLRTDEQFYATTGKDLLKEARDIAKRIDAELPKFFNTLPRKPYGVIKVPDAIAPKYTGGRYSGSQSSTEPGYYLVNTYKLESRSLYNLPALTAHEAVPGHHLQISLNQELGDSIPEFRKGFYLSAYGEGWALYTEFLAEEMGIYTTPYEQFGKLTYEMWRACRLVVDTGIHAKGWSREKVVEYMKSNTALSEHEINTETDRYIGWPAQAISYKMGELKIRELRTKAEKELGADFNIRDFHEVILEQGTVTLPILEKMVNKYIEEATKI